MAYYNLIAFFAGAKMFRRHVGSPAGTPGAGRMLSRFCGSLRCGPGTPPAGRGSFSGPIVPKRSASRCDRFSGTRWK